MCEDMSPVKALTFLQTEVSAVVDHSDTVETETFRSLLTYLLSPTPPSPVPCTSALAQSPLSPNAGADSPPQNNSGSSTPEKGCWTNELHLDDKELGSAAHGIRGINADALKEIEDPVERDIRHGGGDCDADEKLTSMRFSQRNEVFESLLEFISEGEKQPKGSLLDLIDGDGGKL